MKPQYLFCLALIGLALSNCGDGDEAAVPAMPVIEGYMVSGASPVVVFSSTITPSSDDGSLSDALISWGKVIISDGEKETILTGKVDQSYLPPYVYYTNDFKCEAGKRYFVKADYRNLHASAECHIPYPTPIDGITIAPTENDTLYAATLHFTAPEDTPAYYYVSMRGVERGDIDKMCPMSTIRADVPGQEVSVALLRPKIPISGETYVPNFTIGEKFIVSLNRVESGVYAFWQGYDNLLLTSHSPFISSDITLPSNISGGLGIFSGQGASSQALQIAFQ
ncbi:MAG: DUF4249 domain-containing protein [Clostridium sp.]|nr:DUF4249 domain-containing protein [Clostridium sp.]